MQKIRHKIGLVYLNQIAPKDHYLGSKLSSCSRVIDPSFTENPSKSRCSRVIDPNFTENPSKSRMCQEKEEP
jgi:hypothetical protein